MRTAPRFKWRPLVPVLRRLPLVAGSLLKNGVSLRPMRSPADWVRGLDLELARYSSARPVCEAKGRLLLLLGLASRR